MRYVIIGGGIAGTSAAEELRKIDPDAEVTIVSMEEHRLYSRVLLPRYVKGSLPRERCFLKTEAWYEDQNIERVFGVRAESIDAGSKTVSLSGGRKLKFDKLLLATSGDVLTFADRMHGVSYLRTIDDADHLLQLLNECDALDNERRRAGIIGGSFIAVEYLNFFAQRNIPGDLFMLEETFFGGALDVESFAILRSRIESEGAKLHPKSSVSGIRGKGRVEEVVTDKGNFSLSLIGVGIGIRADHRLSRAAGLNVNVGIVTNEFLETNVPDIYAAGDVAEFYDTLVGRHVVVGNWLNAQAQGKTVAKTVAGERTAFSAVRAYSTNVCGVEVIFIGDTDLRHSQRTLIRGSAEEGGVTQIFIRDDRIVGATLVNRNADRAMITETIRERVLAAEI